VTILLIEHEMELIERLCDDVVVMAEGKFLTRGSFDEVTADRRVQECYLGVQLS
jgi:branched-chain amino acid transport system ATP-binding protein